MIYHVITLRFHSVSVVTQPDKGLCHRSLVMVTFMVTLSVRMMHGLVRIEKFLCSHFICH
jgi:hypothetical protein